jgi:hypothetical protein
MTRHGEHAVLHIDHHHYPLSNHCLPPVWRKTELITAHGGGGGQKKKLLFTWRYGLGRNIPLFAPLQRHASSINTLYLSP